MTAVSCNVGLTVYRGTVTAVSCNVWLTVWRGTVTAVSCNVGLSVERNYERCQVQCKAQFTEEVRSLPVAVLVSQFT